MPYKARRVANSLLERAFKEGRTDMSPMKVQKLLFYVSGWHLAFTGEPACEEPFEVWKYGPVIPDVYNELKHFGGNTVTRYLKEYDSKSQKWQAYVVPSSHQQFHQVLDMTWKNYIGISALQLSAMTHAQDSPWDIAKQEGDGIISNALIKEHFIVLPKSA